LYFRTAFEVPAGWIFAGVNANLKSQFRQSALCVAMVDPSTVALGPTTTVVHPSFEWLLPPFATSVAWSTIEDCDGAEVAEACAARARTANPHLIATCKMDRSFDEQQLPKKSEYINEQPR
jgi:hypothetical protein